jgi:hypothetical protein
VQRVQCKVTRNQYVADSSFFVNKPSGWFVILREYAMKKLVLILGLVFAVNLVAQVPAKAGWWIGFPIPLPVPVPLWYGPGPGWVGPGYYAGGYYWGPGGYRYYGHPYWRGRYWAHGRWYWR